MSLSPLAKGRWDGAFLLATWFGCGYAPKAPGTAGSLAALAIAIAIHLAYGSGRITFLALAALLLIPGIWAAGVMAKRERLEDPGIVVVDEVIGQWITLAGASTLNWKSALAAFVLFRALDVWKPPPARQLERLPAGYGIVADDVMAGLYGALVIVLLDRLQFF
jgi:phosphatidylglycerophosphatase A